MSTVFPNAKTINKNTALVMALSFHHYHSLHNSLPNTPTTSSSKTPPSLITIPSQNPTIPPPSLKDAFLSLTNSSHRNPSAHSPIEAYSSILELCASQKAAFQGQQIHTHILTSGSLSKDVFLITKLLFMYAKCGHILTAQKLFDGMPQRTIFAWNALIGAYASHGQPHEAIALYFQMRVSGVMPDACTLASVLKACGGCEDLLCGSEIHGLAVKCGLISTTFVVNALVAMYAKCSRFDLSRRLFELAVDKRDVVTWNSIMSASLQNGQFFEVLSLFRVMGKAGIEMNSYTAVGVLQACAELLLLKLGMEIHASLLKCSQEFEIFESNALVVMYSRCGRMDEAIRVFHEMREKDNVSWNSILSGYVQNGLYEEAVDFFYEMLQVGIKPDQVSIISVASALGRLGKLSSGTEIHCYSIKKGLDSELQVANTFMDMYTKCCAVSYAERVFHRMPCKDYVSWTTAIAGYAQSSRYSEALELFREAQGQEMKADPMMIGSILLACSGLGCLPLLKQIHGYTIRRHELLDHILKNTIIDIYGECGKVDHAVHVFETMQDKDVVSWTSMITCYVHNGLLNEALGLFVEMMKAKVEPDAVALVSILAAAAGLSSLMKGKEVHGFIIRRALGMDALVNSSLVDMYARCGNIDGSFQIFDRLGSKDLVLWTTMINVSGMHGRGKEAINLFTRMEALGLIPDHVAFLALLYACSHSGLSNEGKFYLEKMKSDYRLEPWPEHYACVVDLLGRSGKVDEAFEFIQTMPIQPTAAVWCALLGACRVHLNHELGKIAAEKLLELEPESPGNYVLASNVFAAMGKWKEVEVVRERLRRRGLMKDPACSWIETGNKVHTFVARDNSHEQSVEIYAALDEITRRLEKEGGYIEDTRFVLHDVRDEEKVKILHGHSERLAIAFGLINTPEGRPIRITKNLRVCSDCHEFTKLVSKFYEREIVVRDANRFHHFRDGYCSCTDFW